LHRRNPTLGFGNPIDDSTFIAVILSMCRYLYYCWHGTLGNATILETIAIKEWKHKFEQDKDCTIGGTLVESMFDFQFESQSALAKFEATVDAVLPPRNEKEAATSYRTIRVQKWFSIPTVVWGCGDPHLKPIIHAS
jgi:hypothetical protein